MNCEAQGTAKGGEAEEKAPIMATPQDASQATTRGEAVNDFVRSPQVFLNFDAQMKFVYLENDHRKRMRILFGKQANRFSLSNDGMIEQASSSFKRHHLAASADPLGVLSNALSSDIRDCRLPQRVTHCRTAALRCKHGAGVVMHHLA